LDQKDKFELNKRILDSVHRYKHKRRIQKYSVAASLTLLVAIGSSIWFFQNDTINSLPSIRQHATSAKLGTGAESEVKLVLGNDQEVQINSDSAEISYSNTGETVSINNERSLQQSSKKTVEPVYNSIVVPYGKRSKISLSDGSKVWLNSGTKLTYPIAFQNGRREVYLVGEAIFEVSHNEQSPFYVVTEDYHVKVLGTVFNVSSYPDDDYTNTALESGSVEIYFPSNPDLKNGAIRITPGTLATFDKKNNDIKTKEVDVATYMSWKEGVFIFQNDELSSILKKVARHYKVQISIENEHLAKQTFSGTLDISKSLDKIFKIIQETTDFEYNSTDNQIKIYQTD